jgi:hypothetical protein
METAPVTRVPVVGRDGDDAAATLKLQEDPNRVEGCNKGNRENRTRQKEAT